tara:strand:+ start:493 stop:654 length:162 start_codon:yes stop_codon:yes gene_type:complete
MAKTTIATLKKERAERFKKKQQQLQHEGGKQWIKHTEKEVEEHPLNKENNNNK